MQYLALLHKVGLLLANNMLHFLDSLKRVLQGRLDGDSRTTHVMNNHLLEPLVLIELKLKMVDLFISHIKELQEIDSLKHVYLAGRLFTDFCTFVVHSRYGKFLLAPAFAFFQILLRTH